ncbi:MAG: dihydroneopterin aldolase [Thermoanaerobaculia bacterium]
MEKLYIKGLALRTIIGTNAHEREEKQDVLIDITLWADLKKAMESDSLGDTIDYKKLKKKIIEFVEKSSFNLIEALAWGIAKICLAEEKVKKVQVCLEKPGALRFAKTVGVEITLEK